MDRREAARRERDGDAVGDLVDVVSGAMELSVRDAPRRAPDVVGVRADDDAHERARARERSEHVGSLLGEVGVIDRDDGRVVGAGGDGDRAHGLRVEALARRRCASGAQGDRRGVSVEGSVVGALARGAPWLGL